MFSSGSVMTSSSTFADLWHNGKLRDWVHRLAKRHGGTDEDIEDMEEEAWARVSLLPHGIGLEAYRKEAQRGVWTVWKRRNRQEHRDEVVYSNSERVYGHGQMKGRYAGAHVLSRPCRGAHGTLCTSILTFEIAAAMEYDNTLWLGSEEYEKLKEAADAEADDGLMPEEEE